MSATAQLLSTDAPTGMPVVTFSLHAPSDLDCMLPAVFTTTPPIPYPVMGETVQSTPFTPQEAGIYRWVAAYAGDTSNEPVSSVCGDPGTTTMVDPATPTMSTTASSDVVLNSGQPMTDRVSISGRVSPTPAARVDFRLYGPGDPMCLDDPVFTSLDVLYPVGGGPVSSVGYMPAQAGEHHWRATYRGDPNNADVTGGCG